MAIDTQTPDTPGWWLHRLGTRLILQRPRLNRLNDYFEGVNAVPSLSGKAARQAYRDLMAMSRTNYAELVVEAVRERMVPVGFRTGASGEDDDDKDAWSMWQANSLDADSALVHRASLSLGSAYVIVGRDPDDEDAPPLITPEDPREVITEQDPRRRRRTLAGLKMYRDDVRGVDVAYLYRPGRVYRFVRTVPTSLVGEEREPLDAIVPASWDEDGALELPAALGQQVPVVPFMNNATMFGRGQSEFEGHLGLLDRISFTILQRLEVATLQAFRQRAVKGLDSEDESGNKIDYSNILTYDPGALWTLPEGAELWESGQVDLGPIRQAIRDDVQDLAAVTRTPLFYLTPEANNGSAEGAALAREGLIFKAGDRITQAGESWEQVMSLAFLLAGDTERGSRADMQVIWADPERYSLAVRYDAAVKAQAAGVPWRTTMQSVLQFSPQEVDRMEAERATDVLLSGVTAPPEGEPAPPPERQPAGMMTQPPVPEQT